MVNRTNDIGASENTRGYQSDNVRLEDFVPMTSRVGWAAIFAGAVIALSVYLILTLLGSAIGLSISDNVASDKLKTGAAVWAIITTVVALFTGGWVTSQCTVGENKTEAVVHGVIMWGVVLFMILWLVGTGMRAGFSAMWGMSSFTNTIANNTNANDWEAVARRNNVPQETINQWKESAKAAATNVENAATNPTDRQAAIEHGANAAWYTLVGTLLSMVAAVVGALFGAGPTFRLLTTEHAMLHSSTAMRKPAAL